MQRSIRQAAEYLRFSRDLGRHEVQYAYLQRTYVLVERAVLRHDEYMLVFKYRLRGQSVGYFYWHFLFLSHCVSFDTAAERGIYFYNMNLL